MSGPGRRVAVVTADPVTARMPGPAIRAWHMAEALAADHDVRLVTVAACDRSHPSFAVEHAGSEEAMRAVEAWCDVLVFQDGILRVHPFLRSTTKVLVGDAYDPFHLENLEQTRGLDPSLRRATVARLAGVVNEMLVHADFLLCASARQRDFWMGALASLGRVNPDTYDEDPTLAHLLAVVPFGLPDDPPVRRGPALRGVLPGVGERDKVILWAGGVYDWFDPTAVVRAVDVLRGRHPDIRLVFLGMRHPNPDVPPMRAEREVRAVAAELGLVDRHVFFLEGWVPYDERGDYLLEADIGVSTHLDHVETAYSWRTRLLDYLWAGLPVVATAGDALADVIETERLGAAVPAGDVAALAGALGRLLDDPGERARCRDNVTRVAKGYRWSEVLGPLVAFCRQPRRAPDRVPHDSTVTATPSPWPVAPWLEPWDEQARRVGRVLVVVPTYEEAATIGEAVRRVRRVLPEAHVLVVDDNSRDGTAAVAREVGADVGGLDVLARPGKQGLGSAYRAGFAWGLERGYDVLVEMDADLSHQPESLPALLAALAAGADLAIGSRYIPGGSIPSWTLRRIALSRLGNHYTSAALDLDLRDATSGFRAYRASVLRAVDLGTVRADGYGFQIEMAYRAARAGFTVVETPIAFADRAEGKSKMSGAVVAEALLLVTEWAARDRLARLVRRVRGMAHRD